MSIISPQGTLLIDSKDIGQAAMNFSHSHLTWEPVSGSENLLYHFPSLVSHQDNLMLTAIPSRDELKLSVFSILLADSQVHFIVLVRISLLMICWKLLKILLKGIYYSSYSKSFEPSKLGEFRPITLCQVSYKIFFKILASRLASLLPKLVSPQQGGFVQG